MSYPVKVSASAYGRILRVKREIIESVLSETGNKRLHYNQTPTITSIVEVALMRLFSDWDDKQKRQALQFQILGIRKQRIVNGGKKSERSNTHHR